MADEPPVLPDRIAGYRIVSRLGAGGMGEVFLAEDDRLMRQVAIKRILPSAVADPHASRRLLVEARTAARLDHPNICAIHEVGDDDGVPFIVMPVVQGETLAARLARGPLSPTEAVDIGAQVADALIAAHAHGVLHRDIKPGNIMVDASGRVRVMDFGLATVVSYDDAISGADTVSRLTVAGSLMGTVGYMSPEQARGDRLDARSDLFSLGVVLQEMITGRAPFARRTVADGLAAVLTEDPEPLARQRPGVPEELQRVVSKALRKSPEDRYQTAADLRVDLRALRSADAAALAPSAGRPRRAAAIGLAGLVLAILGMTWEGTRNETFSNWIARVTHRTAAAPAAAGPAEIGSIAVLPFTNNSGRPDREYLADGITQTLIDHLSQLPNLKVISRSTVFLFKGKTADIRPIAERLRVGAVMTGAISEADGQLAVDVELSDARDAHIILSHRYLQPLSSSVLVTESEIARAVVTGLRVRLTGESQQQLARVPTANAEASDLYLRARSYENRLTPETLHQAVLLYQQAIALDPGYAQAHAGLAQSYLELGLYYDAPRDTMLQARVAASKALTADPNLTDARMVLGLIALVYDWDWEAARQDMTTDAGVIPQAIEMFSCSAHLLEATGHGPDAERELRKALVLDPLSPSLNTELGCGSYYRRRYDYSIQENRDALALDPGNVLASWGLGRAYGQKKMYAEALAELNKVAAMQGDAPPLIVAEIGYVQAASGHAAEARAVLRTLNALPKTVFVDPYLIAAIHAGLGDASSAFVWLDKAYNVKSGFLVALASEPKWDGLRQDPRFQRLQKRVGF